MAIFHFPPAQSTGFAQPYGDNVVVTPSVDNPPFVSRGRTLAVAAAIVALCQPDPWVYTYTGPAGGSQPYAQRQNNPALLNVINTNPPFTYGGPIVEQAIAVALTQPDPWQYSSQGASQPYTPRKLNPSLTAVQVDNPPFDLRGPEIEAGIVTAAQPNPWVYVYFGPTGGCQPYAPRQLSPAIPGQSADPPPFTYGGPIAVPAEIVGIKGAEAWDKPDPSVYRFIGGPQPFAPRWLNPSATTVTVNNPPFGQRTAAQGAELYTLAQPDPWVWIYTGAVTGRQPYGARQLSPGVPGQSADRPPFDSRAASLRAELVGIAQPDPWSWIIPGSVEGRQPYGPRQSAIANLATPIDNPPFDSRRQAQRAQAISFQQPDPWVYLFQGGLQPYAPAPLDPIFEGLIAPIPGAGKKPGFPSYTPQPSDAKPAKPYRPVWDRNKDGELEKHPTTPAIPSGPPPRPPQSIFGPPQRLPGATGVVPAKLPTFDHLVPPDPQAMDQRMKEVQDMNDAIAVLKALGLMS